MNVNKQTNKKRQFHMHSLQHDLSTDSDLYLLLSCMAIWFQSGINFWYSFLMHLRQILNALWSCGPCPLILFHFIHNTPLHSSPPRYTLFRTILCCHLWQKETWVNILKYILYIRVLSLWKWMQNQGVLLNQDSNKHGDVFLIQ